MKTIDPFQLPRILVSDRSLLPKTAGIYFVIKEKEKIVYIGKARNFKTRWYTHSVCLKLAEQVENCEIACLESEMDDKDLKGLEKSLIKQYAPEFNGIHNGYRPPRTKRKGDKLAEKPIALRLYDGQLERIRDLQARFPMAVPRSEQDFIRQLIDVGLTALTDPETGLLKWLIKGEKEKNSTEPEKKKGSKR